jgi:hypothetical protein
MLNQELIRFLEEQATKCLHRHEYTPNRHTGDVRRLPGGILDEVFNEAIIVVYRTMCAEHGESTGLSVRDLARLYETIVQYAPSLTGLPEHVTHETGRFRLIRSEGYARKPSGCFYTPDPIIKYIVEKTLGAMVKDRRRSAGSRRGDSPKSKSSGPLTSEEILGLRALDPAMGSGLFLFAVTDFLAHAYGKALIREGKTKSAIGGKDLRRHRRLIAERCIYGVDVNRVTVEIARLLLQAFTAEPGVDPISFDDHLKCGNTLVGALPGSAEAAPVSGTKEAGLGREFHWASEFPQVFCNEDESGKGGPGFDAVIGNPPYLSFSGRHKVQGGDGVRELYRKIGVVSGWVTTHGLFMMRGLDLVRENGLVSMIVPDQVGHLWGYAPVRARMLERGQLVEVRYWGEGVFKGVTTPSLTFVIRKSGVDGRRKAVAVDRDGKRMRFRPKGKDEWHTSAARNVYEQMLTRHLNVEGFSDPGVHTGNVAKKLIHNRRARGARRVLEGKQIRPFYCAPPEKWLDLRFRAREGEYFRIASASTYTRTDIVIRQTADRPVAARHIHRCHFRNSVLALKAPAGFSVEYMLGVLNSEAARYLYRASAFESGQRTFPQVKVMRLRRLPIPDPTNDDIAPIVGAIEDLVRGLESQGCPVDDDHPLLRRLNGLVWKIYGLDPMNA